MERVTATRSELLARTAQIAMAVRGRDVLREKREQLMKELRETGDDILTSSEALDAALANGRRALALAEALDGPEQVSSAAGAGGRQLLTTTRTSTVMGVRIVQILADPAGRPRTGRGYSMAGSSPRIDEAAEGFEAAVDRFLEYARYELHRVWVVDATLRDGERHIYKRRTFYVDEDSWQIVAVDQYDNRDQLWRVSEAHVINYYNVPTIWTALEVHTDLQAGRYLAIGLNSEYKPYEFDIKRSLEDYTPAALRRSGVR